MLCLSRKLNEAIRIGDNITVTVMEIQGSRVKLLFDAPREIPIVRTELLPPKVDAVDRDHYLDSIGG